MHTFQNLNVRFEFSKHAEVRMFENAVQNVPPIVRSTRVEQRLYCNAVRKQKDDAQQGEVEQFNYLQYIMAI